MLLSRFRFSLFSPRDILQRPRPSEILGVMAAIRLRSSWERQKQAGFNTVEQTLI